jgi:hypothetical protein
MRRLGILLKYLFWIALLGFLGLVAFSLVSDLPAPVEEITVPLDPPGAEP